ncbi:MAG TPA: hypothetical protein VI792_09315, partial [Candidatus Eisenbacteria bacterium]
MVSAGRTRTVRDLVEAARSTLSSAPARGPVALVAATDVESVAAACWLADGGRDGLVLARERLTDSVARRLEQAGLAIVDASGGRLEGPGCDEPSSGRVFLLTSGSTGEPKLI